MHPRGSRFFSRVDELTRASVPAFPGLRVAIGAGFIWAALAQGSGELIFWPYLTSKYDGAFLALLFPAIAVGYVVNYAILRYTIITGEGALTGFARISPAYGALLWAGIIPTFIWFGGYVSAGATAIAALSDFPPQWTPRAQSLLWSYLSVVILAVLFFTGRRVYAMLELLMKIVAITAIIGLILSMIHSQVIQTIPRFISKTLTWKDWPTAWEERDLPRLLTTIAFTGMGGYLSLMYGYWIRDKGLGMSAYIPKLSNPIRDARVTINREGFSPSSGEKNARRMRQWLRAGHFDNLLAVTLNAIGLVILCLLSLAFLAPTGAIPSGWEIAVVQSEIFRQVYGPIGGALFLLIAALFLADSWVGILDGVSRMNADYLCSQSGSATVKGSVQRWYYGTAIALTAITLITIPFPEPGFLLIAGGVCNFAAMTVYIPGLIYLNYVYLPRISECPVKASRIGLFSLIAVECALTVLFAWYIVSLF